jgi:hypothetical protein
MTTLEFSILGLLLFFSIYALYLLFLIFWGDQ